MGIILMEKVKSTISEFSIEYSSGGSCGSHLLIKKGENYIGHFYPDASDPSELDEFLTLFSSSRLHDD